MKIPKFVSAVAAGVCLSFSVPASASIVGWFDLVNVASVDVAYGWVCDNWLPAETPLGGVLSVYVNGSHHTDFQLTSGNWGSTRTDAAPYCNGYSAVGFSLMEWYWAGQGTTVDVYFKHNDGTLQQLGGTITLQGPGDNY